MRRTLMGLIYLTVTFFLMEDDLNHVFVLLVYMRAINGKRLVAKGIC
jgi:hypothetical protein